MLCRGFAHVQCTDCSDKRLVAFGCGGRGFCPSSLGRQTASRALNLTSFERCGSAAAQTLHRKDRAETVRGSKGRDLPGAAKTAQFCSLYELGEALPARHHGPHLVSHGRDTASSDQQRPLNRSAHALLRPRGTTCCPSALTEEVRSAHPYRPRAWRTRSPAFTRGLVAHIRVALTVLRAAVAVFRKAEPADTQAAIQTSTVGTSFNPAPAVSEAMGRRGRTFSRAIAGFALRTQWHTSSVRCGRKSCAEEVCLAARIPDLYGSLRKAETRASCTDWKRGFYGTVRCSSAAIPRLGSAGATFAARA